MAKIAKKYYTEEQHRLEEMNHSHPEISRYARNLNLEAIKGNLSPIYNREEILSIAQKILLRRNKANILLVGAAGCGKTAIAEALASLFVEQQVSYDKVIADAKKAFEKQECEWAKVGGEPISAPVVNIPKPLFYDCVIYDLSMNALLSGAQYRGQFEERIQNIINLASCDKHIILFIDEIHQINAINGTESQGTASMGQILKPALARGDIRVIGATTTEESRVIKQDKALARRFSEVYVPQLSGEVAVQCLENIMADYSKFHDVKFDETISSLGIYLKTRQQLPHTVFPNNVIDIVDEVLASAKFEGKTTVSIAEVNAVIGRMIALNQ